MKPEINVVLVDDEPFARQTLNIFLAELEGFRVVEECSNGLQAIQTINRLKPDLIFLDIQMPEVNGFEVLNEIETDNPDNPPVVIFATAYEKYALQAFEANAVDYLLKPFERPRFREAILKAVRYINGGNSQWLGQIRELLRTYNKLKGTERQFRPRILVKEKKKYFLVDLDEVYFFEASGDYVVIHKEKSTHMINDSMNNLEDKLDPDQFVRIHRSTIINIRYIDNLQPYFNGEFHITMKNGAKLKLSRNYRDKIKTILTDDLHRINYP
jgi:two-component system, LytTR family, response regulator